MTREESVKVLHKVIREHWCDEFEYGESCKHCSLEITLCEPLFEVMYPDFFNEARSLEKSTIADEMASLSPETKKRISSGLKKIIDEELQSLEETAKNDI